MCFIDSSAIHASTKHRAPPLIKLLQYGVAIEIHGGIILDFYTGLPHMWFVLVASCTLSIVTVNTLTSKARKTLLVCM